MFLPAHETAPEGLVLFEREGKRTDMITAIILSATVVLLSYVMIPSYMVSQKVLHPRAKTLDEAEKMRNDDGIYKPEDLNGTRREDIALRSDFGYDIYAVVIYNKVPSEHAVILSHGVTCRSELMFRYLKIFLDMGYNVVFMDHRCHGRTGGDVVSYGYFEKYDLAKAVRWAKEHFNGRIGLFGESMGAGISMQAIELTDVDFLIEDCGYSSFGEEIHYNLRSTPFVFDAVHYLPSRLLIKLRGKYDIEAVSPVMSMAKAKMPVLIIHGKKDSYVPYTMGEKIFNAVPHDNKQIYAPEAEHAYSVKYDTREYKKQIKTFLMRYGLYFGDLAATGKVS